LVAYQAGAVVRRILLNLGGGFVPTQAPMGVSRRPITNNPGNTVGGSLATDRSQRFRSADHRHHRLRIDHREHRHRVAGSVPGRRVQGLGAVLPMNSGFITVWHA
jgi:hypothetical protein